MRKSNKTTVYEARGWRKFSEEDTYENGCLPDTGLYDEGNDVFEEATIDEVLDAFCQFFDVKRGDCYLDADSQPGRVDACKLEDAKGERPSKEQIEAWEKGEERLWYSVYTIRIQKVTRERVSCKK